MYVKLFQACKTGSNPAKRIQALHVKSKSKEFLQLYGVPPKKSGGKPKEVTKRGEKSKK